MNPSLGETGADPEQYIYGGHIDHTGDIQDIDLKLIYEFTAN